MVTKGRSAKGEKQHLAKLTEDSVREIRARHAAGETMLGLSAEYDVHFKTVWNVVKRRTWRHTD
jgi:hypothetical protein